jgi:serralysin
MAWFDILNRSGTGAYFAEEAMANWAFAPIVETHQGGLRFFNGQIYFEPHYFTIQISTVPNFPQLFFRFSGNNFTFKDDVTSIGTGRYIAAGSVITTIELIDANGTVYNRLTGLNLTLPSDKIDVGQEPINVFATSWRELETPTIEQLLAGDDTIDGSSGSEFLFGYDGSDTLRGEGSADTLEGGRGNDTLIGGDGADLLQGGDGDDTILGYTAGDNIDGGGNFDTWVLYGIRSTGISVGVTYDMRSVSTLNIERLKLDGGNFRFTELQIGAASSINALQGTAGSRDVLEITASTYGTPNGVVINLSTLVITDWNTIYSTDEYDRISIAGSEGGDVIDGSSMRETIWGSGGNDLIRSGGGDDRIFGGWGDDIIRGGDWGDTLYGDEGNDTIIGDDDRATYPNSQPGDDTIYGGAGNDRIAALGGFNLVDGGDGIDTVFYDFTIDNSSSAGPLPVYVSIDLSRPVDLNDPEGWFSVYIDVDFGEVFIPRVRDKLINVENVYGSNFTDSIIGDGKNNTLGGLGGNDTLFGGVGDDTLDGGTGADAMTGGVGNDLYGVDNVSDVINEIAGEGTDRVNSLINYQLGATLENLSLYGSARIGRGNGAANTISGNDSNNALFGEGGADIVSGGRGNDFLRGGLGADVLTGGTGADGFVFDTAFGSTNVDTVKDFIAADDSIWLNNATFTRLGTNGVLNATLFKTIGAGGVLDANDLLAYDVSTGRVYYDQNGTAAGGWVQFARLETKPVITAADFIVF